MTQSIKTTIKTYFETGDKPTQAQFSDFIDSCAFLVETSAQTFTNGLNIGGDFAVSGNATIGGIVSATTGAFTNLNITNLNVTTVSAATGNITTLNSTAVNATTVNATTVSAANVRGANGIFTIVSATTVAPTNITGTNTNNNAAAGSVGEFISSVVLTGSGVALSTGVAVNVTSISLTAGDWDVSALVNFTGGASTSLSDISTGISTTTGTLPGAPTSTNPGNITFVWTPYAPFAIAPNSFTIPTTRISVAATTTVYLVALADFTVSTCKVFGLISARRVR